MKKLIMVFFLLATSLQADPIEKGFFDNINYSVTFEQGLESELKYGYFYASKPLTDKITATYGNTWNIDSTTSEHFLDMSSQTLNLSYQYNDKVSFYALSDINPHGQRTETWVGTTYAW